jgi:hypothetical protein
MSLSKDAPNQGHEKRNGDGDCDLAVQDRSQDQHRGGDHSWEATYHPEHPADDDDNREYGHSWEATYHPDQQTGEALSRNGPEVAAAYQHVHGAEQALGHTGPVATYHPDHQVPHALGHIGPEEANVEDTTVPLRQARYHHCPTDRIVPQTGEACIV